MPSTSSDSTEEAKPSPQKTPSTAIIDFDNQLRVVRARHIRGGRISRSCVTFVFHCVALALVGTVGLVMAIIAGWGSESFNFWISLFTLAVGGFLPNPKLDDAPLPPRAEVVVPQSAP
jgi:hypothetical protein